MKLEEKIFEKLKLNQYKISTAESITGGKIASHLINVSGISDYFKEGYIVYSNEAKMKILNVKKETIDKYYVVSKEVIEEMLEGLFKVTNSDICIATSGYAEHGKISYFGIKLKDKKVIIGREYYGCRNEIRNNITEEVFKTLLDMFY